MAKTAKSKENPLLGSEKERGEVSRGADGRFVKGNKSGGRVQMPEEIKQAFRDLTPEAIKTLKQIIGSKTARDSDKLRAVEIILDRALGKAMQSIDLEAAGGISIQLVEDFLRQSDGQPEM